MAVCQHDLAIMMWNNAELNQVVTACGILCDLSAGHIISGNTLKSLLKVVIDINIHIAWNGTSIRSVSEGALGITLLSN